MLFRKDMEPACSYCDRGCLLGDGEVMCRRNGVVGLWSKCGAFRYNPYNRIPERAPTLKLLAASSMLSTHIEPFSEDDESLQVHIA